MDQFAQYSHAIASLALWALLVVGLSLNSTRGRTAENRCGCGKPKRDYSDPAYRSERAFMNAVETSGPYVAATLAAMLAGASPLMVNILASVFLVSRLVMAFVHIRTENQAMRSVSYVIGWFCIIITAVLAVIAAF
ncbi:MAPEG family protein [Sulfitobacter sp. F26169L]|uniref:MAPEG family protein n=1 Tax=Sulfitobacter sp. F26169L TaxID=2996015 RepID=UPI002260E34E|nr:MAPEG family protein [Sulfitobacter sp. F26169L]MCX7566250.1 MAPEG family protein [Sulfitobacter sp. F26169L]